MHGTDDYGGCCCRALHAGHPGGECFGSRADKTVTWAGGGKGMVLFDGRKHAGRGYVCKDCHQGLFSMKYGTAKITHAELKQGRYCGACHNGTLAFSTFDEGKCFACHQGKKKKPGEREEKKMYK